MKLTWKQRKIVCLMPFLTNREIGEALGGTGINQMKNQCTEIYKKLGVPDYPNTQDKRIAAVVYALRDGEITFAFFVGIATKYTTRGGGSREDRIMTTRSNVMPWRRKKGKLIDIAPQSTQESVSDP